MPGDPREISEAPRRTFDGPAEVHGPTGDTTRPTAVRRMRINKSDLVMHGFHKDCAQSEHIKKYGNAEAGRTHSDACRKQLEDAMRATEEGRERLAAHEESLTRPMVEHIERGPGRQEEQHQRQETKRGFLDRNGAGTPVREQGGGGGYAYRRSPSAFRTAPAGSFNPAAALQ